MKGLKTFGKTHNNSYIVQKIGLRLWLLEQFENPSVLDCYGGRGVMWRQVWQSRVSGYCTTEGDALAKIKGGISMLSGVIYKPAGKAGEYCSLATNLYSGCSHGCVYCYAPSAVRTDRDVFKKAKPRKGIIEKLSKEAASMRFSWAKPDSPVFLCFTCDPYQPIENHYKLTRQAIEILHFNNLDVMILTKGGNRAERDFDLLRNGDWFGITLTLMESSESLKWEPGAGLPQERIDSLRKAHGLGIKTWISLEPVINPDVSLEIIRQTYRFVDLFKVGKMNYHPIRKTVDWAKFGREAIELLESLDKKYYIKEELKKWL